MAKINNPLFSLEAHRTVGKTLTARRSRGQNIIEKTPIPSNPQTPGQQEHRDDFSGGIEMWHTLDAAEKEEYRQMDPSIGGPAAYLNFLRSWLMGTVPKHETRHRASGADPIAGPLSEASHPDTVYSKPAAHHVAYPPKFPVGRYILSQLVTTRLLSSGQSLTPNRLAAFPFFLATPQTADAIAIHVSSFVNPSKCRLGVYADNGYTYPGALILDAGEVDTATDGLKSIPIVLPLQPGLYWLVVTSYSNPALYTAGNNYIPIIGGTTLTSGYAMWNHTQAYGPLPTPYPSAAPSTVTYFWAIALKFSS